MRLTEDEFVSALNAYEKMYTQNNLIADAMNAESLYSDTFVNNFYDLFIEMCDVSDEQFDSSFGCDIDFYAHKLDFGRKICEFCEERQISTDKLADFTDPHNLYKRLCNLEEN